MCKLYAYKAGHAGWKGKLSSHMRSLHVPTFLKTLGKCHITLQGPWKEGLKHVWTAQVYGEWLWSLLFRRSEDDLACPAELWSGLCALDSSSCDCSLLVSTSAGHVLPTESWTGAMTADPFRKLVVTHSPGSCQLWVVTQWWKLHYAFLSCGKS